MEQVATGTIRKIVVERVANASSYEVSAGSGAINAAGGWARSVLGPDARKAALISNKKVFGLYGEKVKAGLSSAGLEVSVWLMGDGERFKNLRSLEAALKLLAGSGISRTDTVVALGGGVVGDLAGFASAVYLRGIRFLQLPTTLLAMIDSSVGGKTGVNSAFGKNLIGSFHQPAGVLADVSTLETLDPRELTAGLCEAVKQAVLAGGRLFETTERFISRGVFNGGPDAAELTGLVADQISFKASIVAGDEFEDPDRRDPGSRKILNFGHTLAHALEKATGYRYFKHGEAVGWGILFAAELSKMLEMLDQNELNLLNDVMRRVGTLPAIDGIDPQKIIEAFRYDKKNIRNELQWVLLERIGKPVIVPAGDVPESAIKNALSHIYKKS